MPEKLLNRLVTIAFFAYDLDEESTQEEIRFAIHDVDRMFLTYNAYRLMGLSEMPAESPHDIPMDEEAEEIYDRIQARYTSVILRVRNITRDGKKPTKEDVELLASLTEGNLDAIASDEKVKAFGEKRGMTALRSIIHLAVTDLGDEAIEQPG